VAFSIKCGVEKRAAMLIWTTTGYVSWKGTGNWKEAEGLVTKGLKARPKVLGE
jgi:hypothetical protein